MSGAIPVVGVATISVVSVLAETVIVTLAFPSPSEVVTETVTWYVPAAVYWCETCEYPEAVPE